MFWRSSSWRFLDLTDAEYQPIDEFEWMTEPVFNLITKHCSDGALETIRLSRVTLNSPHSNEMDQLFGGLKKIRMDFCLEMGNALVGSKACEDLQINGSKWMVDFSFSLRFPKLKKFALRYEYIRTQEFIADCADFLRRHTDLEVLKLHVPSKRVLI